MHHRASAIGTRVSPSSWSSLPPPTPSHPSRLSQSTDVELPASYSKFPLAGYFIYGDVYTSVWLFQFIPPLLSPLCPQTVLSVCISIFSWVQLLSPVRLFATPWTVAHQASLSITSSQSLLKLMSIESVMPSNHLIFCHPLLLLPSIFPSIRVFSNESVLHISWPQYCCLHKIPDGSVVKNPPASTGDAGDTGLIPGWRSLEEKMATHSSIPAWKILWM